MGGWPQRTRTLGEAVANAPPVRRGAMRLHGATPLWSLLQWLPLATNANLFLLYLPRELTAREDSKSFRVGIYIHQYRPISLFEAVAALLVNQYAGDRGLGALKGKGLNLICSLFFHQHLAAVVFSLQL